MKRFHRPTAARRSAMRIGALSAGLSLFAAGCTGPLTHTPQPRPIPGDLQFGQLAKRTAFENDGAFEDDDPTPVTAGPTGAPQDNSPEDDQKRRRALFLAGVIASAIGGGSAIAFGAAGQITENRLDDGYRDGLTRAEEADFQDRGELMNGIAIGSAAIALVGLGLTSVVLGVDYMRCGTLIKRRHKSCTK